MSAIAEPQPARSNAAPERQVYEPHRVGLPPLGAYLRDLWQRREFAFELARTTLRAQHFNTVFGQLWLVLNPLFLGLVYFALVEIIGRGNRGTEFLAHLMLSLFAFRLFSTSVGQGARSFVGGARLILNIPFPRALLPLSAVITSFMRFLPTLVVYGIVHAIAGLPVGFHLLWALPILALLTLFAAGAAMFAATAQVYFRDVTNFLPYLTRIWLYASPVLYYADEIPSRFRPVLMANPLYPMLTGLSDVVTQGETLSAGLLAWSAAWAVAAFVGGGLFLVSRERELAVRL